MEERIAGDLPSVHDFRAAVVDNPRDFQGVAVHDFRPPASTTAPDLQRRA